MGGGSREPPPLLKRGRHEPSAHPAEQRRVDFWTDKKTLRTFSFLKVGLLARLCRYFNRVGVYVQKQRRVTFESLELEFCGPELDRRKFLSATITDFETNRMRIRNALGGHGIRYALLKLQELFLNIGEPAAANVCSFLAADAITERSLPDQPICAELLQFLDCTIRELKEEASVFRSVEKITSAPLKTGRTSPA
jgi:hypothetical protein